MQKILLYILHRRSHSLHLWGFIATNIICGYIWVYLVARILFPLKFVHGHFVHYKKLLNLWRIFHDVFREHCGIAVMGTKAQRPWCSISFVTIRPRTLWRLSKFVTNNKIKILMFYMRKMGKNLKKKSWRPRIELGPSQGRRFELSICI